MSSGSSDLQGTFGVSLALHVFEIEKACPVGHTFGKDLSWIGEFLVAISGIVQNQSGLLEVTDGIDLETLDQAGLGSILHRNDDA